MSHDTQIFLQIHLIKMYSLSINVNYPISFCWFYSCIHCKWTSSGLVQQFAWSIGCHCYVTSGHTEICAL